MKTIKILFHLEKSGLEKKAFDLLKIYQCYSGFNQSQSVIQLILRNEEYINSLCQNERPEQIEKKTVPDFVKIYEENDRIDVFGDNHGYGRDDK